MSRAVPEPLEVVLYTRPGCHLCEEARRALDRVGRQLPMRVESVDIDRHDFLRRAYAEEVPVIWVRGEKIAKYRVDPEAFHRRFTAGIRGSG